MVAYMIHQFQSNCRSDGLGCRLTQGKISDTFAYLVLRQRVGSKGEAASSRKSLPRSLDKPEGHKGRYPSGQAVTYHGNTKDAHGPGNNVFTVKGVYGRSGNELEYQGGNGEHTGNQSYQGRGGTQKMSVLSYQAIAHLLTEIHHHVGDKDTYEYGIKDLFRRSFSFRIMYYPFG
jgi:hypothetical protein